MNAYGMAVLRKTSGRRPTTGIGLVSRRGGGTVAKATLGLGLEVGWGSMTAGPASPAGSEMEGTEGEGPPTFRADGALMLDDAGTRSE
jgi:hypothetical protein